GKVPLTVVSLTEGVKDALAEAAVQAVVDGLNQTGRFAVNPNDVIATTLLQEGASKQDILDGKGLAKAASRSKIENLLVILVRSVQKKPFMDVRLYSFPGPSELLTTGFYVPASVRPVAKGDFSASDRSRPNQ